MNTSNVIAAIDRAIAEIEKYVQKYNLSTSSNLITGHIKVLRLLKHELLHNAADINVRVLRGFKDVCTSTAIEHEETEFNDPVFEIHNYLEQNVSNFKRLELLRMDFGKGDPI